MTTHEQATLGGTSASNAEYDRLCPGRHLAQKGLPEVNSESSASGTRIHEALANNGSTLLGLKPDERETFDTCREIERKLILSIWGGEPDQNNRVFRETRFWCKVPNQSITQKGEVTVGRVDHYQHSGQADMVMIRKNIGLILDYKTGSGDVVESSQNEQLRDLAVMVARTHNLQEVNVAIIQPLATWTPELCKYDKADLNRAEQEMWERVRKSNDPNSPRIPGQAQCKWCKAAAAGTCKEYAAWSASMLPEKPSPLSVAMASWSLQERSVVAEHLPRLKKLLEAAEDHLKAILVADPEGVPGFYLKPGAVKQIITDPQKVFERFVSIAADKAVEVSKSGGMSKEPNELVVTWFMQCVRITKKDLEDQIRAVTNKKGNGLKTEMDKLLAGLVESKQNAPSLAKKEDV